MRHTSANSGLVVSSVVVTTISTFTAAQSLGSPVTTPATDCPTVPPDNDHTGMCVEALDISTREGWPVAMDIWLAFRPMVVGSALKMLVAMVKKVMRNGIRMSSREWRSSTLNSSLSATSPSTST